VAGEIHRWYGVTLHIDDRSLLNRHVTASFAGEPIDQVLKILGLTLGARVDLEGDSAFVTPIHGPNSTR
jgi:ferric-dicitrate binding protein FerR (iron transport regulator)